jgi:murein DD-endopeptidase MepM/ murein hydrolase activator NlpD
MKFRLVSIFILILSLFLIIGSTSCGDDDDDDDSATSDNDDDDDSATPDDDDNDAAVPITLWVTQPPTPVAFRKEIALGYELHISDYETAGYTLTKVEILANDENGAPVKTYEGEELTECLMPFNPEKPTPAATVFLWPEFQTMDEVPSALFHKVYFDVGDETQVVGGALTEVISENAMVLSPPVAGGGWLAVNGPSNFDMHHRRTLMSFQDQPYISQRFGVDWLQIGPDGTLFENDGLANEDFFCYGDELLAVGDGTVVNMRDDFPEQLPGDPMPYPLTIDNVAGNFVILDLGDGHYAFYAHVIPGSFQVAVGDVVSAGDVLGLLGNSGNSTAPHLHFQICESSSFLFSQGLPYVFDSYEYQGTIEDIVEFFEQGEQWNWNDDPETVTQKFFENNDVVNF